MNDVACKTLYFVEALCAGPLVGGELGPYRQSERREVYKQYVDELVARGLAYPCFCTDEELEAMKRDAEAKGLPPIYRGRWARASAEEVADMMAKVCLCLADTTNAGLLSRFYTVG